LEALQGEMRVAAVEEKQGKAEVKSAISCCSPRPAIKKLRKYIIFGFFCLYKIRA